MKTLILAGAAAVALTIGGAAAGHAASTTMSSDGGASSSMSSGSGTSAMASQGQIRAVQEKLKSAGLYQGKVDGIDGKATRQALAQFQAQNGLDKTGKLDQQTLAKLNLGQGGAGSSMSASSTPQARPA